MFIILIKEIVKLFFKKEVKKEVKKDIIKYSVSMIQDGCENGITEINVDANDEKEAIENAKNWYAIHGFFVGKPTFESKIACITIKECIQII
jgi:hypothetical protein